MGVKRLAEWYKCATVCTVGQEFTQTGESEQWAVDSEQMRLEE